MIEHIRNSLQEAQRALEAFLANRFGAVVANSAGVSLPSLSASAPPKRSAVATAHSSNVSRLLPSLSSLRNAAVRVDIISIRLTLSLRSRS